MIKLEYIIAKDNIEPEKEYWTINSEIKFRLMRDNNRAFTTISNSTGDIADQVYELARSERYFSSLKLIGGSNYNIELPLEETENFLQFIEAIDQSLLKEGHSY